MHRREHFNYFTGPDLQNGIGKKKIFLEGRPNEDINNETIKIRLIYHNQCPQSCSHSTVVTTSQRNRLTFDALCLLFLSRWPHPFRNLPILSKCGLSYCKFLPTVSVFCRTQDCRMLAPWQPALIRSMPAPRVHWKHHNACWGHHRNVSALHQYKSALESNSAGLA